jgi:predicted phosphodiesterase
VLRHGKGFVRFSLMVLVLLSSFVWAQQAATTPATQPVDLLAEASWQFSTDGGVTFTPDWPAAPSGQTPLVAKAEFQAGDLTGCQALELTHELDPASDAVFTLNGKKVEGPKELPGVFFKTIPVTDPNLLVQGTNVLTATWRPVRDHAAASVPSVPRLRFSLFSLKVLRAGDLKVVTGPILGARGEDFITVSCRTNMPARVTVRVNGGFKTPQTAPAIGRPSMVWQEITKVSPPGLFHQVHLEGLKGMAIATYRFQVETPDGAGRIELGPWSIAPLAEGQDPLRFVVLGDSRSRASKWAIVAAAALKARPQFIVHAGDLVEHGRQDWRWNEELFEPAATLLATVPTFAVLGNHEEKSPLAPLLLAVPPDNTLARWQQTIGPVHLIGIDGEANWAADSENAQWLEGVLAASKAKFIFLVSHYPPWSSGKHGVKGVPGEPKDLPIRQGREVILPLLAKHKASAVIAGHDHLYERSEPPDGVTVIVTGGGGAPLSKPVEDAKTQNPYSKVLSSVLHYCLFTVEGGVCSMQAFTPSGEVIDTRVWSAREVAAPRVAALTAEPASK